MTDPPNTDQGVVHYVESIDDLLDLRAWLGERREWLAVDVETTGLNAGKDFTRLIQFGDPTRGFAVPFQQWKVAMKELIEGYRGKMVAHNLLYDSKMLKKEGIELPQHLAHDTMVMARLLDSMMPANLKPLAAKYVDPRARAGQNALKLLFQRTGWDWPTVPVDHPIYWQYGVLDTVLTSALAEVMWPKMQTWRSSYEMEIGVLHVIRDAELKGMAIDLDYTQRAVEFLQARLEQLRPQIPCDPHSDIQLIYYLKSIGAHLTKRTEKGHLSVDKTVLKELEPQFPIAGTIREYKEKHRLLTAYLQKFLDLQAGGRLYPNTHPLAARTGRMSVTEPPLQQLPRGRIVRDCFIAEEGSVILKADFEQQELRTMAALGNVQEMLEQFRLGTDLHKWVAACVYGLPLEQVTKPQRSIAKNAQFGLIYGAGTEKFAETAEISFEIAVQFMDRYNHLFPGVAHWQQRTIQGVRERAQAEGFGYVTTRYGRRLMVEKDKAYAGCNYVIQGSCAEITKRQLLECANAGLGDMFRLAVHDELLFEVPEEDAEDALAVVESVMPDYHSFEVPLTIEAETVPRWGVAYEEDYGAPVIPLERPEERSWDASAAPAAA